MVATRDNRYAIVGMGLVVGPKPGFSARALTAEAARIAIEDAGLKRSQIDAALEPVREGGGGIRDSYSDAYPRVLGLTPNTYLRVSGRGASLAAPGIVLGSKLLDLGTANYVVIANAVEDWSAAQRSKQQGQRGMVHRDKAGYWGKTFGDLRAASHHSFFMSRHKHLWGTTDRQQAMVAVSARRWANLNPLAKMYGRPLTVEDYFNAPMLVYPYRLLDICQISDGAVAFVLTTLERAAELSRKPVYVLGVGFGEHIEGPWWEKRQHEALPLKTGQIHSFRQAGIELKDISFAQFPDCFTAEVMLHVEDYGWCEKGEGGAFVEEGHIAPGGDTPCNTYGGWLSAYHFGDMSCFSEAILQLRGEAGERQLKDPKFGIVAGGGGELLAPGMCSIHSTLVLGSELT